ncbi:MAG: OmpP1/FadL family transporter [Myxococcaceae bacterium]
MKKLSLAVVSASVFAAASAQAAGFALDTHSARVTGMAGATVAINDEASAIAYNPAGLAATKGFNIQAGLHVIIPGVGVEPKDGSARASVDATPVTPPHAFVAAKLSDDVGFGVGLYTPFGNSAHWPAGWAGEQLVTTSSLQTFFITPAFGFKIHDRVRVGLGMNFVRGTVGIERALNFVDSKGSLKLGGAAWGTGANAGLQVDIVKDMLSFGASYQGEVTLPFEGSVHFSGVPQELQTTLKDQSLKAPFTLPATWALGLGFKPMKELTIAADAWYQDWVTFKNLAINFEDPSLSVNDPKNWHGVWSVRVGGEYAIDNSIKVRAGFKWDPTPSPEDTLAPNLPDSSRITANVGGGYKFGDFSVDAAYQLTILTPHESTYAPFPGTYGGLAHVIGLTLGYHLDSI